MNLIKKTLAGFFASCIAVSCIPYSNSYITNNAMALSESIADTMTWDTAKIGGGGFVSGIVTGQKEMYLRTDVGGAYKYDYENKKWVQLFDFLNDKDRGYLSVKGMAIDPTNDDIVYFLCGCAYFSDAKTVIFKTTDGGKTFTQSDVTDLIQVHGNGDGRECIEPIAIDPDNPDTIYAGGDVTYGESALIKSTDGGKTWNPVIGYDDLGLFSGTLKYPMWTEHIVRGTEPKKQYNEQNGIGCIIIEGGKVYVGTSVTGQANIHVADVKDDKFTELSEDLPTANYPCSITNDGQGNLFFTYIAGLAFGGASGGAYKYNTKDGKVTKLSVSDNAIGMIEVDKNDPKKMLARTCGVWSDQWYETEWTDNSIAWGDHFFRSTDGGETWQNITPGQQMGQYTDNPYFVSEPIDTNGYDWIYGKACHWGSGILLDPRNPDRIVMTSGNGVFACDNVWDEKGVQFYFQPDGVEEVVTLDLVSVPDGYVYSAIGDYDGFIHKDMKEIPEQYKPNIGSTSAISYCPQNTDVMVRFSEHDGGGFYSTDAGKTWNKMENSGGTGGKACITQLDEKTYRIFHSAGDSGKVQYTDDFGKTWEDCSGIPSQYGSKPTFMLSEPEHPEIVYAYATYYNSSWFYSKPEPTDEDAQYKFCVSTDYGKTFTSVDVCMYDQCDSAGRIAYLSEGEIILGAGYYGMYQASVKDGKATIKKLDNVSYCKTVGYGAPEKAGGINTLFMYGKPDEDDAEGIYRSTDGGKTWVCINTEHLFGGTGNGNFIVGDMNEFGKMYMSTVGSGLVYGELSDGNDKPPVSSSDNKVTLYGDSNVDNDVTIADAVLIMQSLSNNDEYQLSSQGMANADVIGNNDGVTNRDALVIQQVVADVFKQSDLPIKE